MAVLIQFVHPYPHRSRINRAVVEALRATPELVINDLYANYPDLHVDVEREQQLLRKADTIVFQHPFYWYSGPALLKEWIDVVLDQGFAYGPGGNALHGKNWLHSITTGMAGATYHADGLNRSTVTELLKPFERTAGFCGMRWLEPLVLHDALDADEARVTAHAAALLKRLGTTTAR